MDLFICKGTDVKNKISLENSAGERCIDEIIEIDTISQNELFKNAVTKSDQSKYSIVLYTNVITVLDPHQVTDFIDHIVKNLDFDVFYLTRYSDDCRAHDDFHTYKNVSIMRVKHPHGIEAMIISPKGKHVLSDKLVEKDGRGLDYILNGMGPIMNNYSSFPLVFNIDLNQRNNDYELVKGVLCSESVHSLRPPSLTQKNTSSLNLFWFVLVLVFIFCIAGALITLTDEKKKPGENDIPPILSGGPYNPTGEIKTYGNS